MKKFLYFILILFVVFPNIFHIKAQSAPKYSPRVLFIGIDPTNNAGSSLANTYFGGIMGKDAADFEVELAENTIQDFKELSGGRINYVLADHIRLTDFPSYPNGYEFTVENYSQCVYYRPEYNPTLCEQQKHQFQYETYFIQNNICEIAAEVDADEIWIVSPPYILAWEAFMVGPTPGFWVNGPHYLLPTCEKNIIVVNATYDRPENMLHSYGHRVEFTIDYLFKNLNEEQQYNYWERFSARNHNTRISGIDYCGNVHYPFNHRNEYDFSSTIMKNSTCSNFSNFPNYDNSSESYTCAVWGCNDRGWQKHWMSYIPKSEGEVQITNKNGNKYYFKKDWWYYILYPENAIHAEEQTVKKGDANGDGMVNGLDYIRWLNNYQTATSEGATRGDFNEDGAVDGLDYVVWLNNYTR